MLGAVRKLLEAVWDWVSQLARFLLNLHLARLTPGRRLPSTSKLFGRKVSPSLPPTPFAVEY